jgi:predicted alpha-1,2-mannosidase
MYLAAGQPWKTQQLVRDILHSQYNDKVNGLCGNEDCGQMSAWYVFSAMGLYPMNPAAGVYHIGSPLFDKVRISLEGDKNFEIIATDNSPENKYVQKAFLNGKLLDKPFITHTELMNGGSLKLLMGSKPNKKNWTDMNH